MRNWEVWKTNIEKSNNHRMIQQVGFHTQQTIIEPGENPTRTFTWKLSEIFGFPKPYQVSN